MSFNKIVKDIKDLKIQGAQNVANEAVKALAEFSRKSKAANSAKFLSELEIAKRVLFNTRPTEPAMRNALNYIVADIRLYGVENMKKKIEEKSKFVLAKFEADKKIIEDLGARKIKDGMTIFTHCHSSTVSNIIIKAKKQGKNITVHNTETRPLFQGRRTAKDMAKAGIPVTLFVDSAARLALKKADLVLLGADAITAEGKIINKIGTELMCGVAASYKIPTYFCTHSWKFDPKTIKGFEEKIEERHTKEVWKNPPKGVKISNYAFEQVSRKLATGIISELGILTPDAFIAETKKTYPWMLT